MKPSLPILLKMGKYKFEIHGAAVEVHVADDMEVIESDIVNHLKPLLDKHPIPVVGIDVKLNDATPSAAGSSRKGILVLCVATYCLVVQTQNFDPNRCCDELIELFDNSRICFVGVDVCRKLDALRYNRYYGYAADIALECKSGIEVDELAARILNKPGLSGHGLADVAREVGIPYEPPKIGAVQIDWAAKILSDDVVKFAVYDAYTCYRISQNLVGPLEA